jgi:hypothetical protein
VVKLTYLRGWSLIAVDSAEHTDNLIFPLYISSFSDQARCRVKDIMAGPVLANISFIQDNPQLFKKEKPYMSLLPDNDSFPITNCVFASNNPTLVHDMRSRISDLRLDDHGFIVVKNQLRFPRLAEAIGQADPPAELIEYLSEATSIVKNATGAAKAYCIDWRAR